MRLYFKMMMDVDVHEIHDGLSCNSKLKGNEIEREERRFTRIEVLGS